MEDKDKTTEIELPILKEETSTVPQTEVPTIPQQEEIPETEVPTLPQEEIKISIPTNILPVKNHEEDEIPEEPKEDKIKFYSTLIIIVITTLLIITTIIIYDVVRKDENNTTAIRLAHSGDTTSLIGTWKTNDSSLFSFDDETFYWYENANYLLDNYYSGNYTYKTGLDALEEMGYTEEDFQTTFTNVDINNVYSITLNPTIELKNHKNIKTKESWWLIIIIDNDGKAQAYNKTLDTRYTLTRN